MSTRTLTLTPNGSAAGTQWVRTGGSTNAGVVTDGDDATFMSLAAVGGNTRLTYTLTTDAMSGVLSEFRVGLRHKKDIAGTGVEDYRLELWVNGMFSGEIVYAFLAVTPTTTIVSEELTLGFFHHAGGYQGDIGQAQIDNLVLGINRFGGGTARWIVYEAYLEVDIEENPPGFMVMT